MDAPLLACFVSLGGLSVAHDCLIRLEACTRTQKLRMSLIRLLARSDLLVAMRMTCAVESKLPRYSLLGGRE